MARSAPEGLASARTPASGSRAEHAADQVSRPGGAVFGAHLLGDARTMVAVTLVGQEPVELAGHPRRRVFARDQSARHAKPTDTVGVIRLIVRVRDDQRRLAGSQ